MLQVLVEQHRVDRHVDERIHPRQPTVLKRPEASERAIDPSVVAALLRHHARQLADDEHFRNRPHERHDDQDEKPESRPDLVNQRLGRVRPARGAEEQHEHERERAKGRPRIAHDGSMRKVRPGLDALSGKGAFSHRGEHTRAIGTCRSERRRLESSMNEAIAGAEHADESPRVRARWRRQHRPRTRHPRLRAHGPRRFRRGADRRRAGRMDRGARTSSASSRCHTTLERTRGARGAATRGAPRHRRDASRRQTIAARRRPRRQRRLRRRRRAGDQRAHRPSAGRSFARAGRARRGGACRREGTSTTSRPAFLVEFSSFDRSSRSTSSAYRCRRGCASRSRVPISRSRHSAPARFCPIRSTARRRSLRRQPSRRWSPRSVWTIRRLLRGAVDDRIAEPARAPLIPAFHDVKRAALDAGALGCSISGGGPSVFALADSDDVAQRGAGRDARRVRSERRPGGWTRRVGGRARRAPRWRYS